MKKKVLVVDDDQLILYGLKKALSKEALEVTAASSVWLAEEVFHLCQFDLCLLDIHYPDYLGLTWLNFVKQNCPATKVILMTASYFGEDTLQSDAKEATANLAYHLLAKPFDLGEVKEIVRKTLGDDGFPDEVRFSDNNYFAKKNRRFPRFPHSQELDIAVTIFCNGEMQRRHIGARSVDISEGGIGLLTRYPLRVSQIISFNVDQMERTGIVVGSAMQPDGAFLARVRFT